MNRVREAQVQVMPPATEPSQVVAFHPCTEAAS